MPRVTYYEDVKVIKKPLKQRLKQVLKIFLILVLIVGCFLGGKYLSRALTVGNLGALIVYGDTKLTIKERTFYAVTMGEYDNKEDAERVAMGASIQGAGGYVWEGEKYFVVGNIYLAEKDAESVVTNLKESQYSIGIMSIHMPRVVLDYSMYDNSDMGLVHNVYNIFGKVYEKLYGYSISFDKGEVSHLAVSSNISSLRGEVKSLIVSAQNLINKQDSSLSSVQQYLVKLDEVLDQAILKTIDNSSTNYSLKYALTNVVRLEYELLHKLSQ